jgi:hypothetical protein
MPFAPPAGLTFRRQLKPCRGQNAMWRDNRSGLLKDRFPPKRQVNPSVMIASIPDGVKLLTSRL